MALRSENKQVTMNTNEPDPRSADPREAERVDPKAGQSDDPRVDPTPDLRQTSEPGADEEMNNASPGDGIMEDVLTEERDVSPERREEVAHTQAQDP
jgi:hypothetical protein